ncbi:MAG TPA: hypothetical protein VMK12_20170 [Anaeromyxobacteraceae bacterium]|nr:hypothetical protein [Anaeromyxobacteraceae bacterium]
MKKGSVKILLGRLARLEGRVVQPPDEPACSRDELEIAAFVRHELRNGRQLCADVTPEEWAKVEAWLTAGKPRPSLVGPPQATR